MRFRAGQQRVWAERAKPERQQAELLRPGKLAGAYIATHLP
jgi:hypothetical protein